MPGGGRRQDGEVRVTVVPYDSVWPVLFETIRQLIEAARTLPHTHFIVATEEGIFHKMIQAAPGKTFVAAPAMGKGATCLSCAHCPWMKMNDLPRLSRVLETGENEIAIPESIRLRAEVSLRRMVDFTSAPKVVTLVRKPPIQ